VFNVSLAGTVQGGFDVGYTSDDDTATVSDADYIDNDGTLNFAGTTDEVQQITVQVNGDETVELDELFGVALGTISGLDSSVLNRLTVAGSPLQATIVNDDSASISITGPGSLNEGTGSGTTAFEFTVTLDNAVTSGFDLAFATSDGSATTADNDYAGNSDTLSFSGSAGESQTIQVLVNRDARVESDETFQLTLGQLSELDPALAALVSIDTTPVVATILDDDTATIAFTAGSSDTLEADGQHTVAVQLNITDSGTLSEAVSVNVVVSGGTATAGDFTLNTTSITFPEASADGATQNVELSLIEDQTIEDIETIILGINLSGTVPGVSLGSIDTHTVSVTDDPMDAVVSGRVWVDANGDGDLNLGELTVAGVSVQLTGTTLNGETVNRDTTTNDRGLYRFTELSAGTYTVSRTQDDAFLPNDDQTHTVEVSPSENESGQDFAEPGLKASYVNRFRILARPRNSRLFGSPITTEMATTQTTPPDPTVTSGEPEGEAPPPTVDPSESLPVGNVQSEGQEVPQIEDIIHAELIVDDEPLMIVAQTNDDDDDQTGIDVDSVDFLMGQLV
jgi:hypothetical protein